MDRVLEIDTDDLVPEVSLRAQRWTLDDAAAATVATLLLDLAAEAGATLLVASHDPRLLDRLERRGRIEGGALLLP